MNETSDLYLMHHGIKGMHWGVRRFEDASGHLTPAGKRRYAVQDARKYYKINRLQRAQEKNRDPDKNERLAKRIRRVQTRSDRKHADLTQKDINIGRQIVAKNRRNWAIAGTAVKTGLTAAGAYALYQNPKTRAFAPLAVAGGAALTYGSAKKVPYYTMEARRYKQVNPKGATNRGLTKRQKNLRKIGKVAAGAVLAGATGYALYKTGAGKAAINAGRNALASRTGIKIEKNPGKDFGKTSNTHEASRKIIEANKKLKNQQSSSRVNNKTNKIYDAARKYARSENNSDRPKNSSVRESSRKIYEAAKNYASENAKKAASTAKSKASSAIRNKIMDGIDESDPRTWVQGIRNAKDTVSNARRYGRTVNNLRKGDKVGAVTEVSDELTNATNKLIEGTQQQINKLRDRRKRKK